MDPLPEMISVLLILLVIQCSLLLVLVVLARARKFLNEIFTTAHTRRGPEQVLRDPVQASGPPLLQEKAVLQAVQEASGVLDVQESLYQRNLPAALVTGST